MPNPLPVSAILITKNEAHNLPRCIGSLGFCSQIVVVDSGSSDNTVQVARDLGAQVTKTEDWPGFGPQKNRALDLASQPWVFSIDADEWVTPELESAIRQHVTSGTGGAEILRASSFCGRVMQYSGWGDDWVLRLFPRESGRFSQDLVHERVMVSGSLARLDGVLNHESFLDLSQVLYKIDHYSSAWAEQAYARGRRGGVAKAIVKGLAAFVKTLVLKQGFRDGLPGLLLAVTNGHGTFYKYAKLWLLSR